MYNLVVRPLILIFEDPIRCVVAPLSAVATEAPSAGIRANLHRQSTVSALSACQVAQATELSGSSNFCATSCPLPESVAQSVAQCGSHFLK